MKALVSAALLLCALPGCSQQASPDTAAVDLLLAKEACRDLLLTYGEGLDEVDPAKVTGVLAEDGVWTADGQVRVASRGEFRALWDSIASNPRPTVGVHAISNIRFAPESADELVGSALVTQHRYNPDRRDEITSLGAMMLVQIDLRCTRTDEGWRFSLMELQSVSVADYVHGEG